MKTVNSVECISIRISPSVTELLQNCIECICHTGYNILVATSRACVLDWEEVRSFASVRLGMLTMVSMWMGGPRERPNVILTHVLSEISLSDS